MNPPLRVLLVDDEELARDRLRGLVHDCQAPGGQVVGEAVNVLQALAFLAENPCDLVLLDVQLPGRDGLQLAAELRQRPDAPAVVFVTAHAGHALRAFDLDAVDYLTKPVRRERLQAALERVEQRLEQRRAQRPANGGVQSGVGRNVQAAAVVATSAPHGEAAPASAVGGNVDLQGDSPALVFIDRGRLLRVPLGEVLYLKAELKYVTVRTATHAYVMADTLTDLEPRIGPRFVRANRNALIARDAVRTLARHAVGEDCASSRGSAREGWAVCIGPINEWLSVSRRQVVALREALVATRC